MSPDELVQQRMTAILKDLSTADQALIETWGDLRRQQGYNSNGLVALFLFIYLGTIGVFWLIKRDEIRAARNEGWCAHAGMSFDTDKIACVPTSNLLYAGPRGR